MNNFRQQLSWLGQVVFNASQLFLVSYIKTLLFLFPACNTQIIASSSRLRVEIAFSAVKTAAIIHMESSLGCKIERVRKSKSYLQ